MHVTANLDNRWFESSPLLQFDNAEPGPEGQSTAGAVEPLVVICPSSSVVEHGLDKAGADGSFPSLGTTSSHSIKALHCLGKAETQDRYLLRAPTRT